ncbi:5'-nucleotidase domain-containing protein 1 isoform X1 [Drosophila teissieri]|uniref:5'-nucleotidase domain-containing protein 1 isoform X1 n=1 Tax=Drosophila teissieri TaxID=7243 RepID=UPI001CB9F1D3|nr:5'-nucleotidase domain-containing protein 1 isoform X1 [Drosophila teissieri]
MLALGRTVAVGAFSAPVLSIRLATSTKTKTKTNVHKQAQTDVRLLLRNLGKLAQNSTTLGRTAPAAVARATREVTVQQQTTRRFHNSAAENSRYSASTIMTSYHKELLLKDYDIVGFDLDGTLLRYNLHEMSALIYQVLKQFLVEQKGYDRDLLSQPLNLDFLQKGLFLDGPRGNVLKLSSEAQILRATHGTRLLSDTEVQAIYGRDRKWEITTAFYRDPLSTWNGAASTQMRSLLDYFDMPSALVFAQAVDQVDRKKKPSAGEEYQVWQDVQAGLMNIYNREHFPNDKSLYFKSMRAEPERFVLRTDPSVMNWLGELRKSGKKLFLLTGSNVDFANLTATQALGKDWRKHFDFVVTYAKKPGFFTMQRPFMQVDVGKLAELPQETKDIKTGEVYSQGNWHQLHAAMAGLLQKEPSEAKALYFGDNIIQDVYTPVKHRDFDAVAIAEELLIEDGKYPYAAELDSQLWGPYFALDSTPTLWSSFISSYAQLCVPSVEEVAQTAPDKRIVCHNPYGFSPRLPKELETVQLKSCWRG